MKLGIYKHVKTANLYKVIGISKLVTNPKQNYVVYQQLYESVLKGEETKLPYGSLWIREIDDFKKKFVFDEI